MPTPAQAIQEPSTEVVVGGVVHQHIFMAKGHVGPLPDPDTFNAYPSDVRAIILDEFRQDGELGREVVRADVIQRKLDGSRSTLGLWLGFAIVVIFGAIALVCALTNHDWVGGAIGTVDLVALVSVFVYGARSDTSPAPPGGT